MACIDLQLKVEMGLEISTLNMGMSSFSHLGRRKPTSNARANLSRPSRTKRPYHVLTFPAQPPRFVDAARVICLRLGRVN